MTDKSKKKGSGSPKASIGAEFGATAKAEVSIQHTKTTEIVVPADVTRSKADAWLDLISPLTQWAGLQGDKFKNKRELLRVYQDRRLTEIVLRAREKLGKLEGSGRPAPLKFMIPFVEKASIEDDEPELTELWASLLASSFTDYKPEHIHFSSIIAQMSAAQAGIFTNILGTEVATELEMGLDHIEMYYGTQVTAQFQLLRFLKDKETEWSQEFILQWLDDWFNEAGVCVVMIAVDDTEGDMEFIEPGEEGYRDEDSVQYSILEALGLIRRIDTEFIDIGRWGFSCNYYTITRLGLHFAVACHLVK